MNIDHYIDQALRSETPKQVIIGDRGAIALIVEVLIAAGSLADLLKKQVIYGKPITQGALLTALSLVRDTCASAESHRFAPEIQHVETRWHPRLFHAALGGVGEWTELLEALLEDAEDDRPLDLVNAVEEVGDSAWYLALALDALRESALAVPPNITLETNVRKLMKRYPDRFTLEESERRDVGGERAVIEGSALRVEIDSDGGTHD